MPPAKRRTSAVVAYHRAVQEGSSEPAAGEASRSPLRFLAPLALVVAVIALVVVVTGSQGVEDGGDESGQTARTAEGGAERVRPPKTYTVQPGDSLGKIAEQFEIPVERLVKLNKDVDSNALSTGQELQLHR